MQDQIRVYSTLHLWSVYYHIIIAQLSILLLLPLCASAAGNYRNAQQRYRNNEDLNHHYYQNAQQHWSYSSGMEDEAFRFRACDNRKIEHAYARRFQHPYPTIECETYYHWTGFQLEGKYGEWVTLDFTENTMTRGDGTKAPIQRYTSPNISGPANDPKTWASICKWIDLLPDQQFRLVKELYKTQLPNMWTLSTFAPHDLRNHPYVGSGTDIVSLPLWTKEQLETWQWALMHKDENYVKGMAEVFPCVHATKSQAGFNGIRRDVALRIGPNNVHGMGVYAQYPDNNGNLCFMKYLGVYGNERRNRFNRYQTPRCRFAFTAARIHYIVPVNRGGVGGVENVTWVVIKPVDANDKGVYFQNQANRSACPLLLWDVPKVRPVRGRPGDPPSWYRLTGFDHTARPWWDAELTPSQAYAKADAIEKAAAKAAAQARQNDDSLVCYN